MPKNKKSPKGKPKQKSSVPAAYVIKPKGTRLPNSVIMTNREYIGQCDGNTTWGLEYDLRLNPSDATTFPWLSAIASRYEVYKFRKLKLIYASASPTTYGGSIMVGVDPDVLDSSPDSKTQMMTMKWVKRCNTWDSMEYNIPFNEEIFPDRVRYCAAEIPSGADAKTYDIGQLVVASDQTATGYYLGELYLEYEVELALPCLHADALVSQMSCKVSTDSCTPAHPITTTDYTQGGLLDIQVLADGTQDYLVFPEPGIYVLNWFITGTNITKASPDLVFDFGTGLSEDDLINAATTTASSTQLIQCDRKGTKLYIDWIGHVVALATLVLRISRFHVDSTFKTTGERATKRRVGKKNHVQHDGLIPVPVTTVNEAKAAPSAAEVPSACPPGWEYVRQR